MTKRPTRFLSRLLFLGLLLVGMFQGATGALPTLTGISPNVQPAKGTANSIYSFYCLYRDPDEKYFFPEGRTYLRPPNVIWTGGTAGFIQAIPDTLYSKKPYAVDSDQKTIKLTDVSEITIADKNWIHVYEDKTDSAQELTVASVTANPPTIVLESETQYPSVYVTFYGRAGGGSKSETLPLQVDSKWTADINGRQYSNTPQAMAYQASDPQTTYPVNKVGLTEWSFADQAKLPPAGVTQLKLDFSYVAMGSWEIAHVDPSDPNRMTLLMQDDVILTNGNPTILSFSIENDQSGTDWMNFIDNAKTSGNKLVLTKKLPDDADTPGHMIHIQYLARAKGIDMTQASAKYYVDLSQDPVGGTITKATKDASDPTDYAAGGNAVVDPTNKKRFYFNTLWSGVKAGDNITVEYGTLAAGGNHIRVSPGGGAITGVYGAADTTGPNYITTNGGTGTSGHMDPNDDTSAAIIDFLFDTPLTDATVFVATMQGGNDNLQIVSGQFPWSSPVAVYDGTVGEGDNYYKESADSWDPDTLTIKLSKAGVRDDGSPINPVVVMRYRDTVWVVGDTFGPCPMMHYRGGSVVTGLEYRVMLSAGLDSQNTDLTTLNGYTDDEIGHHPFVSAPGLSSLGLSQYAHSHYFRCYVIDPEDESAKLQVIRSDVYAGPTVADTNAGSGAAARRFGSTQSGSVDWMRSNYEVDPLEPLPLQITTPDEGTGSTEFTFRVVYRSPQNLPPSPWLASGRDPWRGTTYNSGVVVYIDDLGDGHYQPHFMIPEDPNDTDYTDGAVYVYRLTPQSFGTGIEGMPCYNDNEQNMYRVLTAGSHTYFFACSDDFLFDWNGRILTDPMPEPIPGPDSTYLDYLDFSTYYVDRPTHTPGPRTTGYQFDYHEYPKVAPVLSRVDEPERWPLGGALFLGTLKEYQAIYAPSSQASDQYPTSGLRSGQIATFRVTYTNSENQPPLSIRVHINNTSDSSGPYEEYEMSPLDPTSTDYRAGVVYIYQTTLAPGPHTYYFTTIDQNRPTAWFPKRPDTKSLWQVLQDNGLGQFSWSQMLVNDPYVPSTSFQSLEVGNDYVPGPYVNTPPVLSDQTVTPSSGPRSTKFTFDVVYRDPDGQRPTSAWVIIQLRDGGTLENGGAIRAAMVPVGGVIPSVDDYKNGVHFTFTMSSAQSNVLQPGIRRFYFEFTDDWGMLSNNNIQIEGERSRYPAGEGTWIEGPNVTDNQPPTIEGKVESTDKANNTASVFTYTATYADPDDNAPAFVNVYISSDNGVTWQSPKPMSKRTAADTIYWDGCTYEYKTQLGLGQYIFKFATSDDGMRTIWSPTYTGPNVTENKAPTLTEGNLSPTSGAPSNSSNPQMFDYSIKYTDLDGEYGQAPLYVRVFIDGKQYEMAPVDSTDITYKDGKGYKYSTTLAPGNHRYHFEASDGKDTAIYAKAYDPRTTIITDFTGPVVVDLPTLTDAQVTPSNGGKKSDFDFSVVYRDPNGLAPDAGYPMLYLDDPNELDKDHNGYVMDKVNPADTNYTAGVKYHKILSGLTVGTHSFHMRSMTNVQVGNVTDRTPIKTDEVTGKPVVANALPVLTNGELDRNHLVGTTDDSYPFRVKYQDADGDSPIPVANDGKSGYIYVQIDGTKRFPMSLEDATKSDFTIGTIFVASVPGSEIGGGSHTYSFVAKDYAGADEVTTQSWDGPAINSRPALAEGKVDPTEGSARTIFNYTVKYSDPDGTAPEYVRVYVDGTAHDMQLGDASPDYKVGATFKFSTQVASDLAKHEFSFEASDGIERNPVKFPIDGSKLSGPTIMPNTLPKLSDHSLTPENGTTADLFTWKIKYADNESDPPSKIQVLISDRNGDFVAHDMTRVATDNNTYKNGVMYEFSTKLGEGQHQYRFEASDGSIEKVSDPATDAQVTVYDGPFVVTPETWSHAHVTPDPGTLRTIYQYKVVYTTDAANPSLSMTVNIDGKDYAMTKEDPTDENFADGVEFIYGASGLTAGVHQYSFKVSGSENKAYPEDGSSISGPRVNMGPTLTECTVTPMNTRTGGTFIMSVKYTDPDGARIPPSYVQAIINGTPYDMVAADGVPDYSAGVVYTYETPVQDKKQTLTVSFKAKDDVEEVTAPSAPITVSVNTRPTLTADSVNPPSGSSSTKFTYKVTYTDADNEAPTYIKVYLSRDGGQTWDAGTQMTKVGTTQYSSGVEYQLTTTIKNPGQMHYIIRAWDGFSINGAEDAVSTLDREGPSMSFAAIALNVPQSIMLTQSATITGVLTTDQGAALANQPVVVTFFRPDGNADSQTVTTDANGQFSRAFTPDMDNVPNASGSSTPWTIRAVWDGNATYSATKTDAAVNVTPAEMTVPTSVAMISVPVMPRNEDPSMLFDPISSLKLARYMPGLSRYLVYGVDSEFPNYTLGSAYWVKATGTAKVRASGRLASQTSTYTIPLLTGWNMFSSVHIKPVDFGKLHVVYNGEEVTLATAATRGWIRDYAWRWDANAKSYRLVSAAQSGAETTLLPWEGYWIRSMVNCDLIIPAVVNP